MITHSTTDVLIIGAGPSGLMLACQLKRFNIACRIIDKQADRAKESRAFGIQAKSMEIFQNLGLTDAFMQRVQVGQKVRFYANGELKFNIDFTDLDIQDTPFPAIYFLPQSETEEILINYLQQQNISIDRQSELLSFTQEKDQISANIQHHLTGDQETITCRYLVGCDGAHSKVREILNIPFIGKSYTQNFVLADVEVDWPYHPEGLIGFFAKQGNLIAIPLTRNLTRIIIMGMEENPENTPYSLPQLENFISQLTRSSVKLSNPAWVTNFRLHHRIVKQYQSNHVFLAGDAAHIHTPVGAQGMNTGLQDVTNLAWKIAMALKHPGLETLLQTYQQERHPIGQILVNTTDRIFGFVTSKNPVINFFKLYFMPFVMRQLLTFKKVRQYMFKFISELDIHYPPNAFIVNHTDGADDIFLKNVPAGHRAPDAPINNDTLFERYRRKPFNILLLNAQTSETFDSEAVAQLQKLNPELIGVHVFDNKAQNLSTLFERYGVTRAAIYFIRPDGYIGFRSFGYETKALIQYLCGLEFNT